MGSGDQDAHDLVALRLWIARLATDYERILAEQRLPLTRKESREHRRALAAAQRTCDGLVDGPGKDRIRELIAAGAARYGLAHSSLPDELLPEEVIVDFAVHALWPLIVVPKLPKNYFEDLATISSESLARLVTHARLSRTTGSVMSPQIFAKAIAGIHFAPGVLNLLNDLADPRRGASAFTAISIASTGKVPARRQSPKAIAAWILSAAAAGVVGNRTDELATKVWDWLFEAAHTATSPGSAHGPTHSSSDVNFSHHHGQASVTRGEGLIKVVEEFIHSLF